MNSASTKFQLKLTIFIFWTKLAQKGKLHTWSLHTVLNFQAQGLSLEQIAAKAYLISLETKFYAE